MLKYNIKISCKYYLIYKSYIWQYVLSSSILISPFFPQRVLTVIAFYYQNIKFIIYINSNVTVK